LIAPTGERRDHMGDSGRVLSSLAPARRRLVLVVIGVVAVAAVALAILIPRWVGDSRRPVDQAVLGPVLVVHGYGGTPESMQTLVDAIEASGRDAEAVWLPDNNEGDLTVAAEALDQAVREAMDRTGAPSVDLVGYSAGGIVSRIWASSEEGENIVRRVLTLGSPHHGTTLADTGATITECTPACEQMTTGSDLLRRLNVGDETPVGPTWVSIWSEQDETVTPPETSRLEGALNIPVQSVCPDAEVSHNQLPNLPLMLNLVVAELGAGDPVPLTESDCMSLVGTN
jgi:triacylglycerol esterase/lipase EstA (alpha/beta hydrolase family)